LFNIALKRPLEPYKGKVFPYYMPVVNVSDISKLPIDNHGLTGLTNKLKICGAT